MNEILEALARRTEELACHDASCAPPPVGTGGSKPAGPSKGHLSPTSTARVKPDPAFTSRAGARKYFGGTKEMEDALTAYYTHSLGGGYESAVQALDVYDDEIHVTGAIFHESGDKAGTFIRKIHMFEGELIAGHDTLKIRPAHQGQGLASSFNDQLLKTYEDLGVDRIELTAALSHGPFAWARQGYRYTDTPDLEDPDRHGWVSARVFDMRRVVEQRAADEGIPERAVIRMQDTLRDLTNASARGADVQPIHVASIGEGDPVWSSPDGSSWLGKDVLISTADARNPASWDGVFYLGRESALTSALERRTEELACRDRSCAPPPIGTGGSKPSGSENGYSISKFNPVGGATSSAEIERAQKVHAELDTAHKALMERAKDLSDPLDDIDDIDQAIRESSRARGTAKREMESLEASQHLKNVEVATVTTNGGASFNVYRDSGTEWDSGLSAQALETYSTLLDEFDVNPVPVGFGQNAVAAAWSMAEGSRVDFLYAFNAAEEGPTDMAFVVNDTFSAAPLAMGVTSNALSSAHKHQLIRDRIDPAFFNPNFRKMSDAETVDYYVTHEFGHLLHNEATARIMSDKILTANEAVQEFPMYKTYEDGHIHTELRLPALGKYAYSDPSEFAAEAFAVDRKGWDDSSGVPLDSLLDWAYDRRRGNP